MSIPTSRKWLFAPVITFREAFTDNRFAVSSRIITALGIRRVQGEAGLGWRVLRYVKHPLSPLPKPGAPEDQYYSWWEEGDSDSEETREGNRFVETLAKFDEVVLPNRSCQARPVNLNPRTDLWQHLFIPCGLCSVSRTGAHAFRFSFRVACGLPKETTDGNDFEVPVVFCVSLGLMTDADLPSRWRNKVRECALVSLTHTWIGPHAQLADWSLDLR